LAGKGATWWAEARVRNHRVALLRPYNLRFHMNEDGKIQLIFFNGQYANVYRDVMDAIAGAESDDAGEWVRSFSCSRCKERGAAGGLFRPAVRSPTDEGAGE